MKVEVLLCSDKGFWAPQSNMYFSQSSKILVSRHPLEVVEEILYTYCPQCFSRFSEDDAFESGNVCPTCKQCSKCGGIVQSKSADTAPCCTNCSCEFSSESSESASSVNKDIFDALVNQYQALSKNKPPMSKQVNELAEDSHWKMSHLEKKLADNETKMGQSIDYLEGKRFSTASSESTAPSMTGVRLRSKRTVRCRKDMEEGKLNILVQPKPYPLDGDSSMKLQTGDWWVKDSSAIHILPLVTVMKVSSSQDLCQDGNWGEICLKFRNPKDSPATLKIFNIPNDQIENSSVVVQYDGVISIQPQRRLLHAANVSNGAEEFVVVLEPYEDELLRGDDNPTSSQVDNGEKVENSDGHENQTWNSMVDGHTAFVKIPVRLNPIEMTNNNVLKEIEFNIGYKLMIDEIDLAVKMKILLPLL